jgi:hypothetical protein
MAIPTSFRQDLNTAESVQSLIEHAQRMAKHITAAGLTQQPRHPDTAETPNLAEQLEADDERTEEAGDAADRPVEAKPHHALPTDPPEHDGEPQARVEAAETAVPDTFASSSAIKRMINTADISSAQSQTTTSSTAGTSNWRGKRRKKQLGSVPELR